MRIPSVLSSVALVAGLVACGGQATVAPQTPRTASLGPDPSPMPASPTRTPTKTAAGDPFALPDGPRDDAPVVPPPAMLSLDGWSRASKMQGIAKLPAECRAYVTRAAAKKKPASLSEALAEPDPAMRDAKLVALEGGSVGLVRALRADLAPIECADAIVDPDLKSLAADTHVSSVPAPLGHVLVGLSIGAKLARTAHDPPRLTDASDKAKVKAFYAGPMKDWVIEQANRIEALGATAAGLQGYGRGIAAIEAGDADLRLVDQVRNGPVPKGWDEELRQVYEAALDQALEPRKARGRDATLVGLSDLVDAGIFDDRRASRARGLLAKLYGGRRIDALDTLFVGPEHGLATKEGATGAEAAALHVSTFWLDFIPKEVTGAEDGARLPVALLRGLPRSVRAAMRTGNAQIDPRRYALARIALGQRGLRRLDFVEAAYAVKDSKRPEDRLLLAVAIALASGPNGARALMTAPSPSALGFDRLEALDALAAEGGPYAAEAAFDAAHLRALTTPEGPAAGPWLDDVAARFRKAAALFKNDPEAKKLAEKRAADAEATRAALDAR